jgi:hypothetical protein
MELIIVVPVIGNLEAATLQLALEAYFKDPDNGTVKHRNAARALFRRLNKVLHAL